MPEDVRSPIRILVVDDEAGYRALLNWRLNRFPSVVELAADGAEAAAALQEKNFDLVITDLTMPSMGGLALLSHIKEVAPQTAVIVITGFATVEVAVHAMRSGASDVLIKPFPLSKLFDSIRRALSTRLPRAA